MGANRTLLLADHDDGAIVEARIRHTGRTLVDAVHRPPSPIMVWGTGIMERPVRPNIKGVP
uniref:Uncharacterized protein n=1 Tax=Anopheles merus TaxID=30066 RepID=A0A182VH87_ANOME